MVNYFDTNKTFYYRTSTCNRVHSTLLTRHFYLKRRMSPSLKLLFESHNTLQISEKQFKGSNLTEFLECTNITASLYY